MSESPTASPAAVPSAAAPDDRAGALLALAFIVLSLAAILSATAPPVDLRIPELSPCWEPSATLRRQWRGEAERLGRMEPGEGAEELVAAYRELGLVEAATPVGRSTEELRAALTTAERLAARFASKHGIDAYRGLGVRVGFDLAASWRAMTRAARKGEASLPVGQLAPEGTAGREVQQLAGRLVDEAIRLRFLNPAGGETAGARMLVELGFEQRWLRLAREIFVAEDVVDPTRRAVLEAWKAEEHPSLSLARRKDAVAQAARLWPDYPAEKAQARIHMRAEDWEGARRYVQAALRARPADPELADALAALVALSQSSHQANQ